MATTHNYISNRLLTPPLSSPPRALSRTPSLILLSPVSRFSRLRSLNLSNNHLGQFPMAICDIPTLTEVNLSCNYLVSVPSSVGAMAK